MINQRSITSFLFSCILLLALVHQPCTAQRGGAPALYPQRIYPGENVITISSERGIERIVASPSRFTSVSVPTIRGCEKSVDVRVTVRNATSGESIDFTVFDCDGRFTSLSVQAENWTIRPEHTGRVAVGTDTCLACRIESGEGKIVDSIVVHDPRFRVEMPPPSKGPWRVVGGVDFHYRVCFRATEVDTIRESIKLYIRRQFPSGGLTQYVIEKPITAIGAPPPPPKVEPKPKPKVPTLPPLVDPTTFRNIVMPTAESLEKGKGFVGTYDLAGWLGGYAPIDRLTLLAGGVFVPAALSKLLVGTIGAKYEAISSEPLRLAVGYQYGYSSSETSDITASTPYAVVSLGNRERRISLAAGYSWKVHTTATESFDRNASIVAIGGDLTISRGWKIAAETYFIESSGIAPVAFTLRRFGERFAIDLGFGIDIGNVGDVRGTSTLAGEIDELRVAPVLSAFWVW